jgi:phenylacetic acid degradation operon negative regulatory protein
MRNKSVDNLVWKLSKGILTSVSDVILYSFILFGSSFGNSATSRGVYKTFRETDKIFDEFNTKSILNSLSNLKNRKKYIRYNKQNENIEIQITDIGRKEIDSIIPFYKTSRPWNGRFYLCSFDIPENKRKFRDILRIKLKQTYIGLLQKSLWFSPYNPEKLLKDLFSKFYVTDWMVVFPVEKYSIGPYFKEKLPELLERIYHLSELNKRYKNFIQRSYRKDKLAISFEYLNILKDDPQLPFELEPKSFVGKQAYEIYKKLFQ